MKIVSKGDKLLAVFPGTGVRHEWLKGSHTANVLSNVGKPLDCYTFAWEKNHASMLDFTSALQTYLEDES